MFWLVLTCFMLDVPLPDWGLAAASDHPLCHDGSVARAWHHHHCHAALRIPFHLVYHRSQQPYHAMSLPVPGLTPRPSTSITSMSTSTPMISSGKSQSQFSPRWLPDDVSPRWLPDARGLTRLLGLASSSFGAAWCSTPSSTPLEFGAWCPPTTTSPLRKHWPLPCCSSLAGCSLGVPTSKNTCLRCVLPLQHGGLSLPLADRASAAVAADCRCRCRT